ncbi:sensor domain-containing diguanylate cyclase [Sulfurimonas sp.]|uniref:sensor domain-containing diguanylate cyclase n=1 Tax=Sulfurimonas sp. TaxID=2022749 RepID=UPI003D0A099E
MSVSLSAKITLTDSAECYKNFTIKYYYDETSKLTLQDIQNKKFKTTKNNFTFGYLSGTTWFKIVIQNNSTKKNFILDFSEILWKSFNFYQLKDGKWDVQYNGLDIPLSQRSFKHTHPVFKFEMPTNSQQTFYIQGKTVAGQMGKFEICTQKSYFSESHFELINIYMIFAFSLISILILNFYSYYLTKEVVYLYYMFYTFTFILFSAMHSGFYLLLGFDGWNEGLHVIGTFVLISLIFFSENFLHIKEHQPNIYKFFQLSKIVFLLFAICIFNDITYTAFLFNLYSIIFFILLFYATIRAYMHGYIGVEYYLIALVIYSIMMGMMILTFNGLLEYTLINRHLFLFGAFIEIVFFTLILANKYRTISLEKLRIQEELLIEINKNEKELKRAVETRTKELELAKKELEKMVRTDHLTKIRNLKSYRDKISELLYRYKRYGSVFSIAMFDIDDFKLINDKYGHKTGDAVLQELTALISNNIRKNDFFFRVGGEEFILLLENTTLEKAKKLTLHLLDIVEKQLLVIPEHTITISIGLTEVEQNDTEDSLYKRVDKLLYDSKENGKNQVSF